MQYGTRLRGVMPHCRLISPVSNRHVNARHEQICVILKILWTLIFISLSCVGHSPLFPRCGYYSDGKGLMSSMWQSLAFRLVSGHKNGYAGRSFVFAALGCGAPGVWCSRGWCSQGFMCRENDTRFRGWCFRVCRGGGHEYGHEHEQGHEQGHE